MPNPMQQRIAEIRDEVRAAQARAMQHETGQQGLVTTLRAEFDGLWAAVDALASTAET